MNLIAKGRDIRKVPTRFEPDGTNDLDRILSMIPLNGGLPFTPYEKAKVIKKAHGLGVEYAEIAEKIGISLEYINAILLPLLESPQAILNEVKTGKLTASLHEFQVPKKTRGGAWHPPGSERDRSGYGFAQNHPEARQEGQGSAGTGKEGQGRRQTRARD